MNPTCIEYGERYADDSGWQRRVEIDSRLNRVEVSIGADHASFDCDEMRWLVRTLIVAMDAAGFDPVATLIGRATANVNESLTPTEIDMDDVNLLLELFREILRCKPDISIEDAAQKAVAVSAILKKKP